MNPEDVIDYLERNLTNHKNFPTNYSDPRSITVQVLQEELWDKFAKRATEMIITKPGRRMFPIIKLDIKGLEPQSIYKVLLEFVQIGDHRWKYVNHEWVQGSKSENKPASAYSLYIHPESPNYGAHWMLKPVEFPKVKLTNKQPPADGQVVLNSLHKYEPRVHIVKCNPGQDHESFCFRLSKTQFMAVTAYQNDGVTDLKINYNPHAKAFHENKSKKIKSEDNLGRDVYSHHHHQSANYSSNLEPRLSYSHPYVPYSPSCESPNCNQIATSPNWNTDFNGQFTPVNGNVGQITRNNFYPTRSSTGLYNSDYSQVSSYK